MEIDLPPDGMEPTIINNDQLAVNEGAVMVKGVNEEAQFEEDRAEEEDVNKAHAPHPLLFHFPLQRWAMLGTHHYHTGVWRSINFTMPTSTLTLLTTRGMMRVTHSSMFTRALGTSFKKRSSTRQH